LKQPLLRGRDFTEGDSAKAAKVAIVNMVFAKRFYGSAENALGHLVGGNGLKTLDTTIVGVVGDAKHKDLRTDPGPTVYRAYAQADQAVGVKMYVRTSQSPELVESSIRQAIHQLDPALVVDGLRTMEEQVNRSASNERALAMLAIGVRLALGAQRSGVVLLVLKEMSLIAAVAVVVALPSIMAVAQLFRSQLYGVGVNDPVTLAVAVGGAAVMVALASVLPARRAASVEPMKALRTD
jgi:putative ABC transport system permease protein